MTVTSIALALASLSTPAMAQEAQPTPRSVRISMETLHQLGGVPPGWILSPPPGRAAAGRESFVGLGCPQCHRVEGESWPAPTAPGPDLSGMGGHHPAGYFAESVFNPNAVLVDGPGYIGADGRSTMPAYPDATLSQLADLVAYLQSLGGGVWAHHMMPAADVPANGDDLPPPPPSGTARYLVQLYDVNPGRLQDFIQWFGREGAGALFAEPGLLGVDTFVDRTRSGPRVITVFTFADDAAFERFTESASADAVGRRFDEFVGPHGHDLHRVPPLYRSDALSARRPMPTPATSHKGSSRSGQIPN